VRESIERGVYRDGKKKTNAINVDCCGEKWWEGKGKGTPPSRVCRKDPKDSNFERGIRKFENCRII